MIFQKNQYAVRLLANTFIPEVGNCLSTMFISYFTEHCADVCLAPVDFYSIVVTSTIFYFVCLDLNLHLEMNFANCYCCILCYTCHAYSYFHYINQQVCSVKYSNMQIIKYNSRQLSNSYMFQHQIAILRNTP